MNPNFIYPEGPPPFKPAPTNESLEKSKINVEKKEFLEKMKDRLRDLVQLDLLSFPEILGYASPHIKQLIEKLSWQFKRIEIKKGVSLKRKGEESPELLKLLKKFKIVVHTPHFRQLKRRRRGFKAALPSVRSLLGKINAVPKDTRERVETTMEFTNKVQAETMVIHTANIIEGIISGEFKNFTEFCLFVNNLAKKYNLKVAFENCIKNDFDELWQNLSKEQKDNLGNYESYSWFYNPIDLYHEWQNTPEIDIDNNPFMGVCVDIGHLELTMNNIANTLSDDNRKGSSNDTLSTKLSNVDIIDFFKDPDFIKKIFNIHLVDCREYQKKKLFKNKTITQTDDTLPPASVEGKIGPRKTAEILIALLQGGFNAGITIEVAPEEMSPKHSGLGGKFNLTSGTLKRFIEQSVGLNSHSMDPEIRYFKEDCLGNIFKALDDYVLNKDYALNSAKTN